MTYRREIDGLRAVALVPVMLFHAGFQAFHGGFVGVDVFFVISGYLITSIILTEQHGGTFSLLSFYERRARRILPALFVVMMACLPFAWLWLLPGDLAAFSKSVMAVSTFWSNILFWRESGYFTAATDLKPLLHTWSLAVEEQYYMLFPLFLLLTWRVGTRWIVSIVAVGAVLSLAVAHWGAHHQPAATFYLLHTRGWELLIGVLTAFYLFTHTDTETTNQSVKQVGSMLGLALLAYAVFFFDKSTPFPSAYALIPTVGTACLIIWATPQTFVGKVLSSRLLVGIGLISYSAYLWHQPLLAFARHRSMSEPSIGVLVCLVLLALALASVTWKYIEMPCRNRQGLTRPVLVSVLGVLATTLIGLGFVGYSTKGFVERYGPEDRQLAGFDWQEAGRYVERRFDERLLAEFTESARKKVLVIGDSYAQDFVNTVYESDLSMQMQLSTYALGAECGNLFVDRDLTAHIREVDRPRCLKAGWYTNPTLQRRMREADVIVLASSWSAWVADLLPDSLANIRQYSHGQIIVMGRKNFGQVQLKELLHLTPAQRLSLQNMLSEEHVRVNQLMRQTLPPQMFLDLSNLVCVGEASCPLFTDRGALISYDGGHLTKEGAAYVGRKLSAHPLMAITMK